MYSISKQLIGEKIKTLRKEKRLTQREFAILLNISEKVLSNYERGQSYPSLQMLNQISNILKIPVEYFVTVDPTKSVLTQMLRLEVELEEIKNRLENIKDNL